MNESQRNVDYLLHAGGLAIVIVAAGAMFWFCLRPMDVERSEALSRSSDIAALLGSADALRAEHARLTKSLAERREQHKAFLARVPDEPREAEFLGQVSRLAKETGIGLSDYRPGPVLQQPDVSTMEVALTCQGSYEALCRFLDGLGRLPRLVTLGRLEIHASQGGAEHTALAKLRIYFGVNTKRAQPVRSAAHA